MINQYNGQDYVFIYLIVSIPESTNADIINGFYQISNGIIIRNFAKKILGDNYAKVYAYGSRQLYDNFINMNGKSYIQIDKNNIFEMDVNSSQLNFDYFSDFSELFDLIDTIISENQYTTVVLFLDDQGNECHFSEIGYFQLYKMFMKFPNNNFLIFNDSCNSGSMIDLIKLYNKIYESGLFNNVTIDIGCQILFSFINLFNSILDCHYNLTKKETIQEAQRLINFYEKTNKNKDISSIQNLNSNDSSKQIFDELIKLNKLKDEQDIKDFLIIIKSFESMDNTYDLLKRYNKTKEIFNESNLKLISQMIDDDNNIQIFINTFKILYKNRKIIDFTLPPHPNIEIITSTDSKNACFSYSSIRINEIAKVNPGSPAMSAFIKEVFLKRDQAPFNFENLQKEMTEYEGSRILYPVKPDKSITNELKKRQWISLYPQHYKKLKNEKSSYSFIYDENVYLRIAVLRTISFAINMKLLHVAKLLAPKMDQFNLNSFNDSFADIVAISAILNKYKDANSIFKTCVINNHIFKKDHQSLGIKTISSIFNYSFTFSKDPINMTAVILNCLKKAVRSYICENVISIQDKKEPERIFKQLLLSHEISLLERNPIHKFIDDEVSLIDIFPPNEKNKKKYKFLAFIENATFSLLSPQSILPAFIISSLITNEYKDEFIQNDELYKNKISTIADDKKKLIKIKQFSECYLLSRVKASLLHLDIICDAYFKNDAMRIVTQELQFYGALFLMNKLTEYLGDSRNKIFVEFIINPIEEELSILNMSTFLIPLILSLINKKIIIYALYAYVSDLQENWYQKVFEILNAIKDNMKEQNYIDLIEMTKNLLSDLKDIKDKSIRQEKIEQMRDEIREEIQCSFNQISKIINISTKKARVNICNKMDLCIIRYQIDQYNIYLKSIQKGKYTNKYHTYLYSSILILNKAYKDYIKTPNNTEIESKGFNANESLTNTKYLYERAANELYTVAYLFDISDKSSLHINEDIINVIGDKSINILASNVLAARYFNVVEMTPITDILDKYTVLFKVTDGYRPTVKEFMGLQAANIHILAPKDKKRKRYMTQNEIEKNKRNNNDKNDENDKKDKKEIESDSYYSDDYFEEKDEMPYQLLNLGLNDEISSYRNSHKIMIQPTKVSHKDQISQTEIESIRKELKLGHGDWTYEAWIAFIYCFNKRMSYINIQFDPTDDYKDAEYPVTIGEALLIIEQFYPIYRIRGFWVNEERIKRFVGKYSDYHYQILKALIRCFDDVDRIVTPLHMFQETYEERTQEKLNLIFDY